MSFIIAAFIGISLAAPFFVIELYGIDHNSGFRALLWRDAIQTIVETNGVGVGYGTEYIKNDFYALANDWYLTAEDSDDRLSIGTHSSLYDVAFRTGILGVLLIGLWFSGLLRVCFDRSNFSPAMHKMNVFAGCMLVVINTVNMGLTTVNFLMSTALYAAWLVMSAQSAKERGSSRGMRPGRRRKQPIPI